MSTQNNVTADDLGKRVTFQFELPNGWYGEVVGTFEEWDESAETYLIRRKDGSIERVQRRGVRAGKVVGG